MTMRLSLTITEALYDHGSRCFVRDCGDWLRPIYPANDDPVYFGQKLYLLPGTVIRACAHDERPIQRAIL